MSCELLKTATVALLAVLTSTGAIASESFSLYVGAGAVRTEFVQFRTGNRDNPDLVSLSLLWNF